MKFRHRRLERAALDSRLDAGERTALLTGAAHKPATALGKPLKQNKKKKKQYIARATKAHRIDQLFFPFHFASPLNGIGSAPGTFKRRACNENGAEHPRKQINTNSSPPPEERESGPWLHLPTVRKASMGEEGKAENKKGREIRK